MYKPQATKTPSIFARFSRRASHYAGQPIAFVCASAIILTWGVSGFFVGFSDTWQLIINTSTTIVTFLMVFLIQSSQNRDTVAMQVKLDELIRVIKPAHNALLDLEELEEDELDKLRADYEKLATAARKKLSSGTARKSR